jgi:hypothetical protein
MERDDLYDHYHKVSEERHNKSVLDDQKEPRSDTRMREAALPYGGHLVDKVHSSPLQDLSKSRKDIERLLLEK